MAKETKFKVGQEVWVKSRHQNGGRLETVEKVGHKYLTVSHNYKFSLEGKDAQNYQRVYASESEHQDEVELANAWREVRSLIDRQYAAPVGMTHEKMQAIKELLK